MATTNDLKNGMILVIDGNLWQVVEFQLIFDGRFLAVETIDPPDAPAAYPAYERLNLARAGAARDRLAFAPVAR